MTFDETGAICVNFFRMRTRDPILEITPGNLDSGFTPDTPNPKTQTSTPTPQTPKLNPETPNLKRQPRNPKPQT